MTQALDVARLRPPWARHASSVAPASGPASPVTFPGVPLVGTVRIALGADLTKPPSSWVWEDITQYVRFASGISTTQGRIDWTAVVRTSTGALTLDNRDGRFSRRNPLGPYFGRLSLNTPIWALVDPGSGPVTRMQQFVNEWPTRWDRSATDSTVPIACAGVMRRLAQGAVKKSALRRAVPAVSAPLAHWPCEDGSSAAFVSSAVPGVANLKGGAAPTMIGAQWPGSDSSVLDISAQGTNSLTASLAVGTGTSWSLSYVVQFNTSPASTFLPLRILAGTWRIDASMGFGNATPTFVDETGGIGNLNASTNFAPGTPHHVVVTFQQVGADVATALWVDGVLRNTFTITGKTLPMPATVIVNPGPALVTSDHNYLGHVAIYPGVYTGNQQPAALAYAGELATDRVRRVAAEEGVPMVCPGGLAVAMGPQPVAAFLDILRDCETVDQGVLYEVAWGLGYQSVNDRTNQPVAMALDRNLNHIAEEPQPADDDQRIRNRWTASRQGGGSATVERASGTMGTQPGGPGLYDDSKTVNVNTDAQLLDQAGWRLHLGQVDEDRYPNLPLRFHGTPDLIPAWLAMPYGARITLANIAAQMTPDLIDAIVEGWSERWDPTSWDAVLNTAPYSPYRVGTLAADVGDVSDTLLILTPDSLSLAVAVSPTDATWQINSSPLWTTNPESFPRLIVWDGEVIRVTSCSGSSSPQTWTVIRSVNAPTVPPGLSLPGTVGNYASTPDTAALDVTGDIDIRCDLTKGTWTPAANETLVAKYQNPSQRSYQFALDTVGTLRIRWSMDGTNTASVASSVPVPIASGRLAVRATLHFAGGANFTVTFYTAPSMVGPWTVLGTPTSTTTTATAIFVSASALEVGSHNLGQTEPLSAIVHAAQVRNGIDGTIVANPDFSVQAPGTPSFVDSTGITWTVNGSAAIVARAGATVVKGHAVNSTGRIYRPGVLGLA